MSPSIAELMERAAQYRRDLAYPLGEDHHRIVDAKIEWYRSIRDPLTRSGDWVEIGHVVDPYTPLGAVLSVWWHEADERLAIDRPEEPVLRPIPEIQPIYPRSIHHTTAQGAFIALPGYIYSYAGRDYTADEAVDELTRLGSMDGWTWRREADDLATTPPARPPSPGSTSSSPRRERR